MVNVSSSAWGTRNDSGRSGHQICYTAPDSKGNKVMGAPKVLFVLFDGLRPDMVRPDTMPHLHGFRRRWAWFPNAASAFPSETRVQVSSFVTGCYPGSAVSGANTGSHGIMGNAFYDPALGFDTPMDTSDTPRMDAAERQYGRLQQSETLAEALHRAGRTYTVLTTGKIGNARLLNTHAARLDQATLSIWGPDVSSPKAEFQSVIDRFGPVPEQRLPNVEVMDWAGRVLLEHMIPEHDADLQVLWLNEPDLSFHYREIGSDESLEALAAVDRVFGKILDWWEAEGRAAGWHIVAASDHAQITVTGQIDIGSELRRGGFAAGPAIGPDVDVALKPGYSGHLVVRDRDPALVERVARWMSEQPWCGLLLTGTEIPGTLPLTAGNVAGSRAPDLYWALRTGDGSNRHGYRGTCLAQNADIPIGGGLHGGFHPVELNNVLSLGGDRIRPETVINTPCGIVDLAPTILSLLDVERPQGQAGRALTEAFTDGRATPAWRRRLMHAAHDGFSQELILAEVDGAAAPYFRGGSRLS